MFFDHGISPEATGNTHKRLLGISEARSLSAPAPTVDFEDPVNHMPLSAESSMPVLTLKCPNIVPIKDNWETPPFVK